MAALVGSAPPPCTDDLSHSEEGAATQGGPLGGLREAWGSLRGNRPFLLFCGINFLWTVGINISGPFFTVHMVEGLGFSADTIAYLATFTTLFNVVALRLAGGLVDRHGAPKMTAIAMLLVPLMPLLWVFASTPVHIGIAKVYGFFAWAGFHVAALPMLLLLAPPRYRSQYMAVFNTVNGVAGVLAPLPASWLYANWGFTSNLLISAGGRMAAGLLFLWLWRPGRPLAGDGARGGDGARAGPGLECCPLSGMMGGRAPAWLTRRARAGHNGTKEVRHAKPHTASRCPTAGQVLLGRRGRVHALLLPLDIHGIHPRAGLGIRV